MDKLENLIKLKALFDDGVLSEKEFSEMKNEILIKDKNEKVSTVDGKEKDSNSMQNAGTLTVSFAGQWFLFDANTKLFINDELHSTHSTKKGFKVVLPFNSSNITLKVVLMGIKSTTYEIEELDLGQNYSMELFYDMMWGKYSSNFNFS